jgi:ribose transport system permease protein
MLALGGLLGTANGLITTRLRVPSFIATLAMLSVARGAASLWSGGYAIPLSFGTGAGQAPPSFKALFGGEANLLGLQVPAPVFYFLGVGALASLVLHRTVFGRHVYAVGGNENAARFSGIAINRVRVWVFALSGALAALAALLHAALVMWIGADNKKIGEQAGQYVAD